MRRGRPRKSSGVGPRTAAAVSMSAESPLMGAEQEEAGAQVVESPTHTPPAPTGQSGGQTQMPGPLEAELLIARAVAAGRAAETEVIARAVAAGRAAEVAERTPQPEGGVSVERARRLGAQGFVGTTDPGVADTWLRQTERICAMMRCSDEQKLFITEFLLEDLALDWWTSYRERQAPEREISWGDFQREFHLKYHSAAFREQKRNEFERLTQDGRTVAEYEALFTRLARYAPALVADESEKCRKFQNGLRLGIQARTRMRMCTTFSELLEAAYVAEGIESTFHELKQDKQKKRASESSRGGGYHGKKHHGGRSRRQFLHTGGGGSSVMQAEFSVQESSTPPVVAQGMPRPRDQSGQSGSRFAPCQKCGRAHPGVCRIGERTCYQCGQLGHYKKDCPLLRQGMQQQSQPQRSTAGHPGGRGGAGGSGSARSGGSGAPRAEARVFAVSG